MASNSAMRFSRSANEAFISSIRFANRRASLPSHLWRLFSALYDCLGGLLVGLSPDAPAVTPLADELAYPLPFSVCFRYR